MNPVLIEFPSEFFTERLCIRLPLPGDGKNVYEALTASIDELRPWLPFVQGEQSDINTEIGIRKAHTRFLNREDLRLHIFLRSTGQFIGSSGLHNPDWRIPKFEIGYWLDTRYSGQGYMTEAVKGISDFAFNELKAKRVEIRCDTLNAKSIAIPNRLGFTLEGTLRNEDVSVDGVTLRDTHVYAKIKQ